MNINMNPTFWTGVSIGMWQWMRYPGHKIHAVDGYGWSVCGIANYKWQTVDISDIVGIDFCLSCKKRLVQKGEK